MRSILLLLAGLISSGCLLAHEIPADVRVQAYLSARGDHVEALIRVPLVAMRDVEFPLKGPGYLDLEHVEPELRTAAEVWQHAYESRSQHFGCSLPTAGV